MFTTRSSFLRAFSMHVQVCFSADGSLLAVACEDKSHTVMVYRWESGILRYNHLLKKY